MLVDKIVRETDAAILVQQGTLKVWLPRGQIPYLKKDGGIQGEKPCVVLTMPEWLARKKELDYT